MKLSSRSAVLFLVALLAAGGTRAGGVGKHEASTGAAKPTIILVHGAFADSSSWDGVIPPLLDHGYPVIAASNPLRGLAIDAQELGDIIAIAPGKVVLVGHSYGGQVITAVASPKIAALVYVDGLAPDTNESATDIGNRFPGATLGPTLAPPVPLADGGKDLYIKQDLLPAQFAADVPIAKARLMAVEQRPATEAALNDKLKGPPAWKSAPSYFVYGSLDKNITPAAHAFMASRAGSRHTIEVPGGSHVVMMSHPDVVSKLILEAAAKRP
jgi:pimeloyl-ACP methyl ester carboxylesterase